MKTNIIHPKGLKFHGQVTLEELDAALFYDISVVAIRQEPSIKTKTCSFLIVVLKR